MLRRLTVLAAALAVFTLFLIPAASAGKVRTYEVTITNLTAGQPFTPPVVATHKKPVHFFEVGKPASFAIKEIAENGTTGPLASYLAGHKHVYDVFEASTPLVPVGAPGNPDPGVDSVTFSISSAKGAKYLSFASMLICTNDGFTGLDGLRLPKKVGDAVTVTSAAYDAGTEINTEDFANIVPPCQGLIGVSSGDAGIGTSEVALLEGGVITPHAGITGGDDLLIGTHGWVDPVVMVEITRTG